MKREEFNQLLLKHNVQLCTEGDACDGVTVTFEGPEIHIDIVRDLNVS